MLTARPRHRRLAAWWPLCLPRRSGRDRPPTAYGHHRPQWRAGQAGSPKCAMKGYTPGAGCRGSGRRFRPARRGGQPRRLPPGSRRAQSAGAERSREM